MSLHIIRLDILLHSLGGFAQEQQRCSHDSCTSFTLDEISSIEQIAKQPRSPHESVVLLAARLGRTPNSLRTIICRWRKGRVPKYWGGTDGFGPNISK